MVGFQQILVDLADPANAIIWEYLAGADNNDTFLGPNGRFNPPGGDRWGGSNDAQALLGQLAIHATISPHHGRLDFDGDGIIHEGEVDRWLEENSGRPEVPPALVDQVRIGATVGLGQDTFGWEEFTEIVGWVGLGALAAVTVASTGGTAAPLWVKAGLVGLAAAEAYGLHKSDQNGFAILAAVGIIGDVASAGRKLQLALDAPISGPDRAIEIIKQRQTLTELAAQSDNPALRRLADQADSLSDTGLLNAFEQTLDTEATALIQQAMSEGASPAAAIAPFREAGVHFDRLERFRPETPVQGSITDANFAQNNVVRPGKAFSPEGRRFFSGLAGTRINIVQDLSAALRDGTILPSQVPIDYVVIEGNRLILNTRTSTALRNAGIPQSSWYGRDQTGKVVFVRELDTEWRALYLDDPLDAQVSYADLARAQLQRNGLPLEGSPALGVDG